MILRDLERLVDAFLDRDRRHDDHELGEAVELVQLKDRAQVDVGFARAGLHLDREVAGRQRRGRRQAIAELNILQVGDDLVIQKGQPVADAEFALDEAKLPLHAEEAAEIEAGLSCPVDHRTARHGELGAVDLLPAKQVGDGFNGELLVIEIGLEVQFHRTLLTGCERRICRSESGSPPCWFWRCHRRSRSP